MAKQRKPTPFLDHISNEDYLEVYEPAQDTFLFLDALEDDILALNELNPAVLCELGPGSGCIITFLASLLGPDRFYMAVDINIKAAQMQTARRNQVIRSFLDYLDFL
jgi:release factor glutamine methyltransferase